MTELQKLHMWQAGLVGWMATDVFPQWFASGIDRKTGGFVEALDREGRALAEPRRLRVQARQIYAFSLAPQYGWPGPAREIVTHGLNYMIRHYRRTDGLFRTLVDSRGKPLREQALLYDQAFVLLSYAAAARMLEDGTALEGRALELRDLIEQHLRTADGSFLSSMDDPVLRESNPHMHLLEACLAWMEVGTDPGWRRWSIELAELALKRFVRTTTGAIGEAYTTDWQPAQTTSGRRVEPGHQFEWAWLLLRLLVLPQASAAALRLISLAEASGVHNGFAVNALHDDLILLDGAARLWPQTERLKAAVTAAVGCGDARYWSMAASAAHGIFAYVDHQVAGLWHDERTASGNLVPTPSPASTLYHLVSAFGVLRQALQGTAAASGKPPTQSTGR